MSIQAKTTTGKKVSGMSLIGRSIIASGTPPTPAPSCLIGLEYSATLAAFGYKEASYNSETQEVFVEIYDGPGGYAVGDLTPITFSGWDTPRRIGAKDHGDSAGSMSPIILASIAQDKVCQLFWLGVASGGWSISTGTTANPSATGATEMGGSLSDVPSVILYPDGSIAGSVGSSFEALHSAADGIFAGATDLVIFSAINLSDESQRAVRRFKIASSASVLPAISVAGSPVETDDWCGNTIVEQ